MRHNTPSLHALGRQLAEWRRPLDEAPDLDEAVLRMLRAVDRVQTDEWRDHKEDYDFSRAAAD